MACSQCGAKRGHLKGCPTTEAEELDAKRKKNREKHRKDDKTILKGRKPAKCFSCQGSGMIGKKKCFMCHGTGEKP